MGKVRGIALPRAGVGGRCDVGLMNTFHQLDTATLIHTPNPMKFLN